MGGSEKVIKFNKYSDDPREWGGPCVVLVDGLQRLTAVRMFVRGELKVFGSYAYEYADRWNIIKHSLLFSMNTLKTREEVLRWYIEMNSGGVVHKKSEINRVRAMLEKEIERQEI